MWLEEVVGRSESETSLICYFLYRGEYFPIGESFCFTEAMQSAIEHVGEKDGLDVYAFSNGYEPFPTKQEFLNQLATYFDELPPEDQRENEKDIEYHQRVFSGKMKFGDLTIKLLDQDYREDPYWQARKSQIRREQEWLNELWAEYEYQRRERDGIPHPSNVNINMKPLDMRAKIEKTQPSPSPLPQQMTIDCHFGVIVHSADGYEASIQIVMLHNGKVIRSSPRQTVAFGKVRAVEDIVIKQAVNVTPTNHEVEARNGRSKNVSN